MDDGRPAEAAGYIEKAIESDRELPDAYVKAGEIHYRNYLRTDDSDYLDEAREEFGPRRSPSSPKTTRPTAAWATFRSPWTRAATPWAISRNRFGLQPEPP